MKDIIIFCQAPADIQYALTIYERNKHNARISIFCINVEGILKFIQSLSLKLHKLVFIPYDFEFSYKNPNQIIKVKRKFKLLYEKHFSYSKDCEVYFFSHFFDFLTFFFVSKLSNKNVVNFINHYDDAIAKNYTRAQNEIKLFIIKIIYKFITGINFDFYKFNKSNILEFPFSKYCVIEIKDYVLETSIFSKYAYKIVSNKSKNVLFLELDYKNNNLWEDYRETTLEIVKILKHNNYRIYIKPHPRLGFSTFLQETIDDIISDYVPAEFIDVRQFNLVLGISSTGLSYFANNSSVKVISMLNIYQYHDENTKKRAFEYLNDLSTNINFIIDFNNFKNELT